MNTRDLVFVITVEHARRVGDFRLLDAAVPVGVEVTAVSCSVWQNRRRNEMVTGLATD